jgi:hypothetical protein
VDRISFKEEERWSSALAGATSAILRPGFMYLSDLTDVVQGRGSEVTPAGGRRPRTEPSVWKFRKLELLDLRELPPF